MRNAVHVLDCTLRDGGYVNDWRFGDAVSREIVELNGASGVEYSELGFIRFCDYEDGKMQFSEMEQIARLFRPSERKLAAMVEIGYGYPVSKFPLRSGGTVDLVRLVIWKRLISEGVSYASALVEKGYEVTIQATRTDQYTLEEFAELVRRFSAVGIKAFYIVDTFGLMTKRMLMDYAAVADENLGDGIRLGYHAHNNLQQAVMNTVAFCERPWRHELMVDASVMGMGRGAGNLCLELLEKHLNEEFCASYDVGRVHECAERCILPIFRKMPWGYGVPYAMSASKRCNPTYVPYFERAGLSIPQMSEAFDWMRTRDGGIRYDEAFADAAIAEVKGRSRT